MPPAPAPPTDLGTEDEDSHTIAIGADVARLKIPTSLLTLQILDRSGRWHPWTTIGAGGVKVGRSSEKSSNFPELNGLASRHMRIGVDGSKLVVEDLGSANGVYLKLSGPVELTDGTRFRVGSHVIEFHLAEPAEPIEDLVTEDGEIFWSRDLRPLAFLDFIRPDGKPDLRWPIIKPDVTVLGRDSQPGRPVDIALSGDAMTSGSHAQIRRDGEQFWLEDLGSRNGTFVKREGTFQIDPGDVLLVGRVLLRAVDAMRAPGS